MAAVADQPADAVVRLAWADWLEEQGQPERAELLRLRQGLIAEIGGPRRRQREARLRELLDAGVEPPAVRRAVVIGKEKLELVLVPPGTFLMGSPEKEPDREDCEGPQLAVTLPHGLWVPRVPITQGQWKAGTGHNPSCFRGIKQRLPVESVDWDMAVDFCARLSERTGEAFRLPAEAEWEYACRAGTTTAFHFGKTLTADQAVIDTPHPQQVGQYPPNAFGLHDMHGCICEWCLDSATVGDNWTPDRPPTWPPNRRKAEGQVLRGGFWYSIARNCRSASRSSAPPDHGGTRCGCRPVVTAG